MAATDMEKLSQGLSVLILFLDHAEETKAADLEEKIYRLQNTVFDLIRHGYLKGEESQVLAISAETMTQTADMFARSKKLQERVRTYLRNAAEFANSKQYDPVNPFEYADLIQNSGGIGGLISILQDQFKVLTKQYLHR